MYKNSFHLEEGYQMERVKYNFHYSTCLIYDILLHVLVTSSYITHKTKCFIVFP